MKSSAGLAPLALGVRKEVRQKSGEILRAEGFNEAVGGGGCQEGACHDQSRRPPHPTPARCAQEAYYIHFTGVTPKPWDTSPDLVNAKAADIKDPASREAWTRLYTMFWEESRACSQQEA